MKVLKELVSKVWILALLLAVSCSVSVNDTALDQKSVSFISPTAVASVSPADMIKRMTPGINLGNTLDAYPNEGDWTGGVVAQSYYFDDYVKAGFKSVRIPVTWQYHFTGSTTTVDPVFMTRVETVVDWALSRGLVVVLDTHHEKWLKDDYYNQVSKLESLWTQIATRFANKSENLVFEILNEPEDPMVMSQVNDMNSRILPIIRQSNPNRNVIVGPDQQNSEYRLVSPTAGFTVPSDPYLIATFHNYNPWTFCGTGSGTWGTAADYTTIGNEFANLAAWSSSHNIPLYMGEFGVVKSADAASRVKYFKEAAALSIKYGFAYAVWDDYGNFQVYNRSARTFDTSVLSAIIPASSYSVPSKIEAENFSAMSGIQTEVCSEGTLNVGWVDTGDWMDYSINVNQSANYKVDLRTASTAATGIIDILIDNVKKVSVTLPNTGGWQNWTTVTAKLALTQGNHTLRVYAAGSPWNFNYMNIAIDTVVSSSSSIVSSVSSSSKSSSSSVSSRSSSSSSSSRASSVASTSPVTLNSWQCNANSGGLTIWTGGVGGWDAGEWIQFNNVNLGAGFRTMSFNYATTASGSYDIRIDSATGTTIGTFNFTSTGSWNTYRTGTCNIDSSRTGTHTIFVRCNAGYANIGVLKLFN